MMRFLIYYQSMLKALEELRSDKDKSWGTSRFIKNDLNRLKAIETFKNQEEAFSIKILLSREGFKKFF